MSTHEESGLKIACLQFSPLFGDVAGNLQRSIAMIEKAADAGARTSMPNPSVSASTPTSTSADALHLGNLEHDKDA